MGEEKGFSTRAVHAPKAPEVSQQPSSVPIYQSSTWRFDTSEDYADVISFRRPGFVYGRGYGNPTVQAFEGAMAELEGTESAYAFASGMAAIHAAVTTLAESGDRIVASPELYGGAYSLFHAILPRYGIDVTYVSPHDLRAVAEALPGAKLFHVETIANPNVTVADLKALAEICEANGVAAVVDNTFASPYLCNPAELAFEVEGGIDPAVRFCDSLELAWVATSLGGIKTLVGHAASTTHRQMDPDARRAAGIGDGLVRVSVGLEDAEDVIGDFDQALEKA